MTAWTSSLPEDERLLLVEEVCRAIDHAGDTGDTESLIQLIDGVACQPEGTMSLAKPPAGSRDPRNGLVSWPWLAAPQEGDRIFPSHKPASSAPVPKD